MNSGYEMTADQLNEIEERLIRRLGQMFDDKLRGQVDRLVDKRMAIRMDQTSEDRPAVQQSHHRTEERPMPGKMPGWVLGGMLAVGMAVAGYLAIRVDNLDQRFLRLSIEVAEVRDEVKDGFEAVDQRFDVVEGRFDAMEERFDAMEGRFDKFEILLIGQAKQDSSEIP